MMIRRALAVFGMLTILCISTLLPTGNVASASSVSTPSIDLAPLQKTCAVLSIHLNGAHHTITCLHTHMPKLPPGKTSYLNQGPCIPYVTTMQIFNYAYSSTLCFEGAGYLGVRIYRVNEIDNTNIDFGWVKWYHEGSRQGHYCTIIASDSAYWGNNTNVTLTQINSGGLRSPSDPICPHF